MQAQTELERTVGGAGDRANRRAIEVDNGQVGAQARQRRRTVAGLEKPGETKRRRSVVLHREIRVAARLIAQQRMP